MLPPVKVIKGQSDEIKKMEKAFNDLFSTAVFKIRQPIEAFFNWLIQKTDIQRATKVRSDKGLIVHVFWQNFCCVILFLILDSNK